MLIGTDRQQIVIIDTGLDLNTQKQYSCGLDKDITQTELNDVNEHGKLINSIINNKLDVKKYCITNIKIITKNPNSFSKFFSIESYIIQALHYTLTLNNVKSINISWGGEDYLEEEYRSLSMLGNKGIVIYIAAGNGNKNLNNNCNYYPACYNIENTKVVGGLDDYGNKTLWSNFGDIVKRWELGYYNDGGNIHKGTSFAAPRALKKDLENE